MKRLLARIKRVFTKPVPPVSNVQEVEALTKEQAAKAIDTIAREHGMVYLLFDDKATADELFADMRRANVLINNLRQQGTGLPPDYKM